MRSCTHNRTQVPRPGRRGGRVGFTLIEVLMVIAIIGVLVGLLIPAVNMARNAVAKGALAMEVQTLANAMEQYKTKFGEYPPDGSNMNVFTRHVRKAWPNIAPSELTDLDVAVNCNQLPAIASGDFRVMDPYEALVFFLGGFSDDPTHPFTGPGGPLIVVSRNAAGAATVVQYNTDRNTPLFDFAQNQLTLEVANSITVSNDEALYNLTAGSPDVIPAYHPRGKLAPFVYFESRTYSTTGGGGTYMNHFSPGPNSTVTGHARPYKSDQVNTAVSYSAATADSYYRYANDRSFQIISAGIDDSFGNVSPLTSPSLFYVYPTGQQIDITIAPGSAQTGITRYVEAAGQPSYQLDNATNFSDGVLGDALDN